MSEKKLGEVVDQLGAICNLEEDDHVVDVVVLMRIASVADGATRFGLSYSPHSDFIVRRGLVKLAEDYESMEPVLVEGPEDDDEDYLS